MKATGERADCRRWREEGDERVAAVGKKRGCFNRRSFCRAPQQGLSEEWTIWGETSFPKKSEDLFVFARETNLRQH